MKKIDILREERDGLLDMMDAAEKDNQIDGISLEQLEARFGEVEHEIGEELRKLEPKQRVKSIMGSW